MTDRCRFVVYVLLPLALFVAIVALVTLAPQWVMGLVR